MTAATEDQRIDDRTGCGCEELVVHAPAERGWYTGDCWWHGAGGHERAARAATANRDGDLGRSSDRGAA